MLHLGLCAMKIVHIWGDWHGGALLRRVYYIIKISRLARIDPHLHIMKMEVNTCQP